MPKRLSEYRRKRDFSATPEPASLRGTGKPGRRFVVHLHHARRRHFDLRLQVGDTLRSWAVPKGPSLDPQHKRLAVEVEDHPLDYGDFEGLIPEGHYGAGTVWIWDEGLWEPEGDPRRALKAGQLHFRLEGSRLHGRWSLVRTRLNGKKPQWLLLKSQDSAVRRDDVADDTPLSEWRHQERPTRVKRPARKGSSRKGQALPRSVDLQLARLVDKPPAGPDWLHELKYDGYRVLLWRDGDAVRVRSRGDQDWSTKLHTVVEAVRALPCKRCILDGELVALDATGRSSFGALQQAFGEDGRTEHLQVMLFDLLYLDGEDLRKEPQLARKQMLEELLHGVPKPLRYSEHLAGNGTRAADEACAAGLEGIICKQADATYAGGRGRAWLKVKCVQSDEYAIVGYTRGKGARAELGSLLLARPEGAGWRYMGRVGTGLDDAVIGELLQRMKPGKAPALEPIPNRAQLRGAKPFWVRPELVAEVNFRGLTDDGLLRQASLKGLRRDRSTSSLKPVRRDRATVKADVIFKAEKATMPARTSRKSASRGKAVASDRVHLTHPERVLFHDPSISKGELAAFYTDLAEFILPGLAGRPLLLMRCPDGSQGECFFQKHLSHGFPDTVHETLDSQEKRRWIYVDDLDGLLGLVQMNVLEYHVWGSTARKLDQADRLVIDLDPAEDVPWRDVVNAALELRQRLERLKLRSFVRTTGGKGLHLVVPLNPAADWNTARDFTHAIAETLAHEAPERFVAVATKARRGGRIFVDYLRNSRGATAVASYSLRNRPGAPIATPLAWDELARLRSPQQFRYANIRRRLARLSQDPWKGIDSLRQSLPELDG